MISQPRGRRLTALTLVALVWLGGVILPAPPAQAATVRVLIVGDSGTQGSAGDWTWRYRLWKHLQRHGVAVDFVGPRSDLFDNVGRSFGSFEYVDPDFDADHAARWGMSFTDQDHPIGELVDDYQPDIVVELLGVNDLVWQDAGPEGLHARIEAFVGEARAADPDIDLVIGRVAQTWLKDVVPANMRIADLPAELSTLESRLVVATTDAGFAQRVDTYDVAHPNARGEVKIAAAVADALAQLGLGPPYQRPLPRVPVGPRLAPTLTAEAGDRRVRLAWSGSPGSDREYLWWRDVTLDRRWRREKTPLEGEIGVVPGLTNGHVYRFRLQPAKGYHRAAPDVRSNAVTVKPLAPAPGRVRGLVVTGERRALRVSWQVAVRARSYRLRWWPAGRPAAAETLRLAEVHARISGLPTGRRHVIAVRGVNRGTLGPETRRSGVPR